MVLSSGEILRTGGKLLKSVTGYNLTQLFVGSKGTLGVITQATLKLIAKPKFAVVLLAAYDDPYAACRSVPSLFHARLVPSACEFVERDGWLMAQKHLEKTVPNASAPAQLLIELNGKM